MDGCEILMNKANVISPGRHGEGTRAVIVTEGLTHCTASETEIHAEMSYCMMVYSYAVL